MRWHPSLFMFAGLWVLIAVRPAPAVDNDREQADEQSLFAAGLRTDGPALLEFLRQRTQATAPADQLLTLARQLADPAPQVRSQATTRLLALGPLALPVLRQAVQDPDDTESAARARRCLQLLEGNGSAALSSATVRLLIRRKPAGTTEALLAYLPFAEDETVLKEVQAALLVAGFRGGEPDPTLARAIDDKVPLRRAVAGEILVSGGGAPQWAVARRLLQDPKPAVRLRIALALAAVRFEEAIPVLIALLSELPPEQARLAEDYLSNLAGDQAPKVPLGSDAAAQLKCRDAWDGWWRKYDGNAILEEFRKRTLTDAQREQILALIRQFGDETFAVREKATAQVLAMGKPSVFLLRQALTDPDPEISQRVQKCLQILEKTPLPNVPAVAARLAALRKPAGAALVLLAYAPFTDDELAAQEVQTALAALAFREGKPDPVLLNALGDRVPVRRAVAAEALSQAGGAPLWPTVRKLLKDDAALVRLRVGLALANGGDKEAVPVLIALLGELPADQAWRAEDCLYRVVGEAAPRVPLGSDPAARRKCRDTWTAWWQERGPRIELIKQDPAQHLLGYTLLVQHDNGGNGRVLELGVDGKPRWKIEGLQFPVNAQMLPGNRVLITEYNGMRITERDLQGKVLWEKAVANGQPVNAQRLPNGNTFIATENQILEVDRAGKEVFNYNRANGDIMSACKLRNGQIVCLVSRGMCLRLDAGGREVKSFPVGNISYTSGLDVLPNGHILVPQYSNGKVVEYDADGKAVWEAAMPRPNSVTRLANGHTLVASNNNARVVELDRAGKVVWEYKENNTRPWRARRR